MTPTTLFTIVVTVSAYWLCRRLSQRFRSPLFNVVVISTAIIISVLLLCHLPYDAYVPGRDIMTFLLAPATVALAVPVYRNRNLLVQYGLAIVLSVGAGSLVSLTAAVVIARLAGLTRTVTISLASKSVTIPFAVEISRIYGGDPALAAAFVVATGVFGSVTGLALLTRLHITDPVARGLAMGTVSHGQGTAMALAEGEQQGAMAGVAMALAGVLTSALAPFVLPLLLTRL